MPKHKSNKPEGHPYAIPLKKMVVPPKTYSMTIPEFCEQLAFARHPLIEGELRIEEALKVQPTDGPHFSEELVDMAQNVALRRASTASVCSSALYAAVYDGRLDFIHPMTGGQLIVTPHMRPEQEINSSCKSPWQQEADKHQARLTDLEYYARKYSVEIVWADVENPMPRKASRSNRTSAKHQGWIDMGLQILQDDPSMFTSDIARKIHRELPLPPGDRRTAKTVANRLSESGLFRSDEDARKKVARRNA